MNITAKMVADLREKTGAGMMDCKKALVAANGDMEAAVENLRKSGIAKAEKKSGRSTNQGKVWTGICDGCKAGAMVEVLCETDFAAKTDRFGQLVTDVATAALKAGGDGCVAEAVNESAKEILTNAIATIGENMQIRRAVRYQGGDNSTFAGYHHMDGRVSVLVEFEGEVSDELKKDICMHIAAFSPRYISSEDIPAEVIAKEKEIAAAADPKLAGKPAEMLEKILAGKINRFYSEVCLMNQPWVRDDKTSLAKVQPGLKIKRFTRWMVGEEL
ncbi:MAG: elongation factor Ts [Lentisphaeria bacterium]|nr:elongation factor Ts [Lentisphaeria bacterium]